MPRLFTGIKIPTDIALLLAMKRGKLKGARWVEKENYHITLSFLGDISQAAAEEVIFSLGRIEHSSFRICINCLDVFGAKKPRTLFAGICCDKELLGLQRKHDQAMRQIGLEMQKRKYSPHVTLARIKGVRRADLYRFMGQWGEFGNLEFEVDSFALFSARDSIGGGPYLVEENYYFDAA